MTWNKQRAEPTQIANKLLRVGINHPAFFDGGFYSGKVRVDEDHICCELRDICPTAHSNTNVCLFESGCIIHAIWDNV